MPNDSKPNNNRQWFLRYGSFVAAAVAALVGYVQLQDQVQMQAHHIENLETRISGLKKWQDNWPRSGRLEEDVRQNKDIEFQKERLRGLEKRLDRLEAK